MSEIFSSIQGEGAFAGRSSDFIRFWGCNIGKERCPLPCDTPYASDNENKDYKEMSAKEIVEELTRLGSASSNLVLTGGEPLLYKNFLKELIRYLDKVYLSVEIETNGTIPLNINDKELYENKKVYWNVSPKIGWFNMEALRSYLRYVDWNNLRFKFVLGYGDDNWLEEYNNLIKKLRIPSHLVWLMPRGTSREELDESNEYVIEKCLKYGYNYSPRLHIYLWGNQRGR